MFFVGHISIAFILGYLLVSKFRVQNVSLSLILFLSILPDIDVLFRFTVADIAHRSITHSLGVIAIIFFIFLLKYKRPSSIIIYSIAYLSHLAIGDLIVGPLNVVYPFGTFYLSAGIGFKTLEHIFIEGVLLAIMATIAICQYLHGPKRDITFPFAYSKKLDPIFYPLVILGILASPLFLLDESQKELLEFPNIFVSLFQSYDSLTAVAILVLHAFSVAIVIFLWIITWWKTDSRYSYQAKAKQHSQHKL
ncbi:MAG: metal-dependent hydrolase [Thermoproteota archaeon]|nr:metal-dependent hydrolase [Thermoproteota archaeon]